MPKISWRFKVSVNLVVAIDLMFSKARVLFILTFLFFWASTYSQDSFNIIGQHKSQTLSFKLINNLIVIPVEVNGSELKFILDTGVANTIMFNLSLQDSLKLKNTQKVRIRGLGEGEYMDAIRSKNNTFKIGKILNGYHMVYLIPGKIFDLSSRMGITINGIIGGDIFKDFIVEVNYTTKRLKLFDPAQYVYKNCKKCQTFELDFYNNKPYIHLLVESKNIGKHEVKLLIDTGGSDALWLFDKSNEKIEIPEKYFEDYLGKGLSGNIYGKRSKIEKIALGDYVFTSANVAYPDSSSIGTVYKHKERNGTLGAGILKRFRIIFDYPNKKLIFKGTSSYYKDPFVYNMSGIELAYNGSMLIPERRHELLKGGGDENSFSAVEIIYSYVYALKPSYIIAAIRKGSPAHRAGLLENDIVLRLNGKPTYNQKLDNIIHMFSTKVGKRITLEVDRNGERLTYSFTLEKIL